MGNASQTEGEPSSTMPQEATIPVYALILSLAVFGNALLLTSILKMKSRRTAASNMLIFNLAICDLTVVIAAIPTDIIETAIGYFPYGELGCKFIYPLSTFGVNSAVFTLVLISFERFIAIVFPFTKRHKRRHVLMAICVVHGMSICTVLPYALTLHLREIDGEWQCVEVWNSYASRSYTVFLSIIQYFVPLPAIASLHIGAWCQILRRNDETIRTFEASPVRCVQSLNPEAEQSLLSVTDKDDDERRASTASSQSSILVPTSRKSSVFSRMSTLRRGSGSYHKNLSVERHKQTVHTLKMFLAVIFVFALCMLPNQITWYWITFSSEQPSETVRKIFYWMTYANSALNPWIYGGLNPKFRHAYRRRLHELVAFICRSGCRFNSLNEQRKISEISLMRTSTYSTSYDKKASITSGKISLRGNMSGGGDLEDWAWLDQVVNEQHTSGCECNDRRSRSSTLNSDPNDQPRRKVTLSDENEYFVIPPENMTPPSHVSVMNQETEDDLRRSHLPLENSDEGYASDHIAVQHAPVTYSLLPAETPPPSRDSLISRPLYKPDLERKPSKSSMKPTPNNSFCEKCGLHRFRPDTLVVAERLESIRSISEDPESEEPSENSNTSDEIFARPDISLTRPDGTYAQIHDQNSCSIVCLNSSASLDGSLDIADMKRSISADCVPEGGSSKASWKERLFVVRVFQPKAMKSRSLKSPRSSISSSGSTSRPNSPSSRKNSDDGSCSMALSPDEMVVSVLSVADEDPSKESISNAVEAVLKKLNSSQVGVNDRRSSPSHSKPPIKRTLLSPKHKPVEEEIGIIMKPLTKGKRERKNGVFRNEPKVKVVKSKSCGPRISTSPTHCVVGAFLDSNTGTKMAARAKSGSLTPSSHRALVMFRDTRKRSASLGSEVQEENIPETAC